MLDARYLVATDAEPQIDFYNAKVAQTTLAKAFEEWEKIPCGGRTGRAPLIPGGKVLPGYRRTDEKRRGSGGKRGKSKVKSNRPRSNFNVANCLKILRFLRGGCHIRPAFLAAGLSQDDYQKWPMRAADPKYANSPYPLFMRAMDQVIATVEAMHSNNVHASGFRKGKDGQPTEKAIENSKWWLTHRYKNWHESQRVDVTTDGEKLPDNKIEMVVVNRATATPVAVPTEPMLLEEKSDEDDEA